MTGRNEVFQALLNLGAGMTWGVPAQGFTVATRKVRTIDSVAREEMPALFQVEPNETIRQKTNLPQLRTFKAMWVIYLSTEGATPDMPGSAIVADAVDAIEAMFEPKPSDPGYPDGRNTMGGMVYKLFIEGDIIKDPGDLDGWGLIVVPITILIP